MLELAIAERRPTGTVAACQRKSPLGIELADAHPLGRWIPTHNGTVIGFWSDNIPGTLDDINADSGNRPFDNFMIAGVCAKAIALFRMKIRDSQIGAPAVPKRIFICSGRNATVSGQRVGRGALYAASDERSSCNLSYGVI